MEPVLKHYRDRKKINDENEKILNVTRHIEKELNKEFEKSIRKGKIFVRVNVFFEKNNDLCLKISNLYKNKGYYVEISEGYCDWFFSSDGKFVYNNTIAVILNIIYEIKEQNRTDNNNTFIISGFNRYQMHLKRKEKIDRFLKEIIPLIEKDLDNKQTQYKKELMMSFALCFEEKNDQENLTWELKNKYIDSMYKVEIENKLCTPIYSVTTDGELRFNDTEKDGVVITISCRF